MLRLLPEGQPFFEGDDLSDLPTKFFVSELIREKIFLLYGDEIPYQAAVLVQEFSEKSTLTKIRADIIVQRETQKGIILGEGGQDDPATGVVGAEGYRGIYQPEGIPGAVCESAAEVEGYGDFSERIRIQSELLIL